MYGVGVTRVSSESRLLLSTEEESLAMVGYSHGMTDPSVNILPMRNANRRQQIKSAEAN
jgi:hypothetical protein